MNAHNNAMTSIPSCKQDALGRLDNQYVVVVKGGKTRIYDRISKAYMARTDFVLAYSNWRGEVGQYKNGNTRVGNWVEYWLDEYTARQNFPMGAQFLPGVVAPPQGVFNLWEGWGLEPVAGSWGLWQQHLLDIICDGERAIYEYLVRWLAYGVQNPLKLVPVAIGLLGKEGAGKSILFDVMASIYSKPHSSELGDRRLITGSFSGHLEHVQMLMMSEAFFAKDHDSMRVLKDFITNPEWQCHHKGFTPVRTPNRRRVLLSANDIQVFASGEKERRWMVLDVNNRYAGTGARQSAYFNKLFAELDNGGRAAFFHYLLKLDLEGFDLRGGVPTTGASIRQKALAITGVRDWWLSCLDDGGVTGPGGAIITAFTDWGDKDVVIPSRALAESYAEWARETGVRHSDNPMKLIYSQLRGLGVSSGPRGTANVRTVRMESLEKCRALFAAAYGVNDISTLLE